MEAREQQILQDTTVTIVGVGALGTHTADKLVCLGVGKIILIDRDIVEESNLSRQCLYAEKHIGQPKALCAKEQLEQMNPSVQVIAHAVHLDATNVDLMEGCIVDGTDNMETRFLLNDYAKKHNLLFVHGAALGSLGRAFCISPSGPCLRCFLQQPTHEDTCETHGVSLDVVQKVASLQVQLLVDSLVHGKHTTQLHTVHDASVEIYDVKKDSNCSTCNRDYQALLGTQQSHFLKFCGSGMYQIMCTREDAAMIERNLSTKEGAKKYPFGMKWQNVTFFSDGRILLKAGSQEEAQKIYDSLK